MVPAQPPLIIGGVAPAGPRKWYPPPPPLTNIYTTEEVLAEVLTFFAEDSWLRSRAVETIREFLSDPAVHIIPQTHESFLSGFELYAARPDKEYSFVDCISMQAMRREEITEALTNDKHFEQEGFRALFRDS